MSSKFINDSVSYRCAILCYDLFSSSTVYVIVCVHIVVVSSTENRTNLFSRFNFPAFSTQFFV